MNKSKEFKRKYESKDLNTAYNDGIQEEKERILKLIDKFDSFDLFEVLDKKNDKFLDGDYSDDELIEKYREELKKSIEK